MPILAVSWLIGMAMILNSVMAHTNGTNCNATKSDEALMIQLNSTVAHTNCTNGTVSDEEYTMTVIIPACSAIVFFVLLYCLACWIIVICMMRRLRKRQRYNSRFGELTRNGTETNIYELIAVTTDDGNTEIENGVITNRSAIQLAAMTTCVNMNEDCLRDSLGYVIVNHHPDLIAAELSDDETDEAVNASQSIAMQSDNNKYYSNVLDEDEHAQLSKNATSTTRKGHTVDAASVISKDDPAEQDVPIGNEYELVDECKALKNKKQEHSANVSSAALDSIIAELPLYNSSDPTNSHYYDCITDHQAIVTPSDSINKPSPSNPTSQTKRDSSESYEYDYVTVRRTILPSNGTSDIKMQRNPSYGVVVTPKPRKKYAIDLEAATPSDNNR